MRPFAGLAAALLLAGLSAGCTANGPSVTLASAAPRGTVAFDSIEGLPEGQFRKLVQALGQEAETRQLAVVSRAEPAQYRIRGYAAASVRGKHTTITWVWDIYDAERQRTLRLSGHESGGPGRRGWAAADDAMLDRIAGTGMAQLAGFLVNPAPAPDAAPAEPPAVVATAAPGDTREPVAGAGLNTRAALAAIRP